MRKIEFIKGFANKKKGDKDTYDSHLANVLVNDKKVAKYADKVGNADKILTAKRKKDIEQKAMEELSLIKESEYSEKIKAEIQEHLKGAEKDIAERKVKQAIFDKLVIELKK